MKQLVPGASTLAMAHKCFLWNWEREIRFYDSGEGPQRYCMESRSKRDS